MSNLLSLMQIGNINTQDVDELQRFNEAIELIDEAFFGKTKVKKIQDAMDAIVQEIRENPDTMVHGTPLADNLNRAIKETFGFAAVHVYWGNRIAGGNPHTRPSVYIFHAFNESLEYGKHQNGFYDYNNELRCYIQMDQTLVTECNLTSEECVAILLHEIGHNFDFSPASVLKGWIQVYYALLNLENLANMVVAEYGRGIIMPLTNIDTYIQKYIPPVGTIVRLIGRVSFNVQKFLTMILSPALAVTLVPVYVLYSPFSHLQNILLRKGEVYADSFAASYGYSAEIATALDKLIDENSRYNFGGPVMEFFSDMYRFDQEVVALAMGGHGSNQKRLIKIMDKLQSDLRNGDFDASMKADLQKEIQRTKDVYDKMLNVDKTQRDTATHVFRRCVDNWYAGKPYMIVPNIGNEYAK